MSKKIGSHVSFSDKGLLNAANEAVGYGSSTFMIYTGAPQNTRRKPIEEQYIEEGREVMKANNIDEIIVHAPYIINLGSYKRNTFELAVDFLQEEIRRTNYLGVKNIVLHPGAYTEKDLDYGIARIAEGLNEVLKGTSETDVKIALETMAGKGTEIGRSFEEIARIMEGVEDNSRLTVCLDTCHVHDAGYDIVNDLDGVLEEFDRVIGLDRLAVIHLNDSKNPRGAGKDRHAPVGAGWIGFDAMKRIVDHEKLVHLPMVLETPWIGKEDANQRPMYEAEIALLRGDHEARFGSDFLEHVEKLGHYFSGKDVHHRDFIVSTWETLKNDAKAKKADPREPMDRLYDMVEEGKLFTDLTEEQINHRLTAWLAGVNVKTTA
ncbi:deoxyribonuclease IV [Paenibacillus alkalitolerans]|uniref:deoxyribonuclease IV n=1 Tax=Paenibacillus alkalitolerans TaxID=2799335 RepID=UPI0018F6A434|nr:deoxyribonuclease IV [Paenibacillus alkalitolerans]